MKCWFVDRTLKKKDRTLKCRVWSVGSCAAEGKAMIGRWLLVRTGPAASYNCSSRCGRTARNNTPSEVLVFHQTLSTPKASYIGRIPSSTPQGRARILLIFPLGSNNKNKFKILSPFHTTRVLRNTLLQYQVQSVEFKQWNIINI